MERRVLENLALVHSIARRYPSETGMTAADLVQEGYFGLRRAAERFEPERGFRFSTYASIWIRKSIADAINKHGSLVSMSAELAGQVRSAVRTGNPISPDLGLAAAAMTSLSLDAPWGTVVGPPAPLAECLADTATELESVDHELTVRKVVTALLATLDPDERRVIVLRFGLDGRAPRSLAKLPAELGLSHSQSRSLLERSLTVLRSRFELVEEELVAQRADRPGEEMFV